MREERERKRGERGHLHKKSLYSDLLIFRLSFLFEAKQK